MPSPARWWGGPSTEPCSLDFHSVRYKRRLRMLHPGASGSPDDAKHESARESVRQRQLRELYEDTETGGDIRQRLPRFGTPDRERREIHRTLLQSMPFAFSARLPPTGRVRRRIRTATRRG